jgi:bifunctional non-homologous end joining protein LigD
MDERFNRLSEEERGKLKRQAKPDWISPMLATLSDEPFSDDNWLFERKLDGYRCLAHCKRGKLQLLSRNHLDFNTPYPELAETLAAQPVKNYIADGEIVAFRGALTSFSRLQARAGIHDPGQARASGIAVYYYLFDLLWLEGYRLTALPLRARKRLLKATFLFHDPLRYTAHRNGAGEAYQREACRKGWEGVIGKQAASRYVEKRARQWLKLKCINRQEFVIGGYTEPRGSREGFGALLIGYYDKGNLRYAGKVGTGFDERQLRELHGKLSDSERKEAAFSDRNVSARGVHWVRPSFVAEIAFTEWTDDGRLRHPRFIELREDKPARKVVREHTDPNPR